MLNRSSFFGAAFLNTTQRRAFANYWLVRPTKSVYSYQDKFDPWTEVKYKAIPNSKTKKIRKEGTDLFPITSEEVKPLYSAKEASKCFWQYCQNAAGKSTSYTPKP